MTDEEIQECWDKKKGFVILYEDCYLSDISIRGKPTWTYLMSEAIQFAAGWAEQALHKYSLPGKVQGIIQLPIEMSLI